MTGRYVLAITAVLIIAHPAAAADNADAQRAEQKEMLEWAKTLRYQARVRQAMAVCERIVATDPSCVDAWIEHGVLALSQARLVVAQEDFIHALAHDPRNPMALVGRAHVHHAVGDLEGATVSARMALDLCNRAIDVGSATAHTWYVRGLARMLLQDGRGLQDFATALSLDPRHMDARGERAHIYRAQGNLEAAIDELTQAVEIRPDYAVGYLSRGRMYYESGDLEASIADCTRALEINPQYSQAWHNRGLVRIEQGDMQAAVGDLTEAISLDPTYASAHIYRGQAQFSLGNLDAARADWKRTRELDPEGWAGEAAEEMLSKLDETGDAETTADETTADETPAG